MRDEIAWRVSLLPSRCAERDVEQSGSAAARPAAHPAAWSIRDVLDDDVREVLRLTTMTAARLLARRLPLEPLRSYAHRAVMEGAAVAVGRAVAVAVGRVWLPVVEGDSAMNRSPSCC